MIAADIDGLIHVDLGVRAWREVAQAQIAVLCQEHGIDSVLTNDRDFERFVGLRVETLS